MTIYDPQKGNEKAEFKFTQEIRFWIWNLSIGTPYYQEGLGSRVLILILCSREPIQTFVSHKTIQRSKNQCFSLPYPDTPGIGPDTPDPVARSVRALFIVWKPRVAQSLRAYTQSLRVPFRPTAISGLKTINTSTIPLQPYLLPPWRAELKPKPRKSSLTLLSPFLSDSLEGFEWEASKSKDSC